MSAKAEQLYVADLSDRTLQLATLGYDGQPANGVVDSPSLSASDGPMGSRPRPPIWSTARSVTSPADQVFTTTEDKPAAIPGAKKVAGARQPLVTPDWVVTAPWLAARAAA